MRLAQCRDHGRQNISLSIRRAARRQSADCVTLRKQMGLQEIAEVGSLFWSWFVEIFERRHPKKTPHP